MPITPAQSAAAENRQLQAAQDAAQHLRLVAAPGTGTSRTIERRVVHVLIQQVRADRFLREASEKGMN
jgi:superfamily I DNA/RNA helicase